ncbi:MAG: T9SS type A sorting domain-containing protein [Ignavibacteriae bacterium]|nr:T9SS type A sorting domain-containing protein [Ignavibacteriota bacterium]
MKNIIYTLALVLFVQCTLTIENCMSQWQPDVRLTNNTQTSYTTFNARCIASSGDTLHVVWRDYRDGQSEIYYKRSIDGGTSWGADTRLTFGSITFNFYYPSVTVSGSVVHVIWDGNADSSNTNYEIYYKRSLDGGVNWSPVSQLTTDAARSEGPSIIASGSTVHAVWSDNRFGNYEIYYKRSIDGGAGWGADTRLSNTSGFSESPSVSVSGLLVNVVWQDDSDGNYEIYYKRSTDGGLSWGADTRLTNNSSSSYMPSVSVFGSNVNVVWHDSRGVGYYKIYYKRSTDAGISWGTDTQLNDTSHHDSFYAGVIASGAVVHVVWCDQRDGNYEIYYKRSTDVGISWGADTRLTNNFADSESPSVAVSGSAVHVLWYDKRDGNYEVYYKRNPTGNSVGIININSEIPGKFSLSQNYPNPFNPSTVIRFGIPSLEGHAKRGVGMVTLKVYDIAGREVQTLVNENLQPGTYETTFDGSHLTSGVYFYKLETNGIVETKKLMLLK